MTDDASPAFSSEAASDLPISSAPRAVIRSEQARVAGNPLGSQTRSLGQNIDALRAIVDATLSAVESLETELQGLRAR